MGCHSQFTNKSITEKLLLVGYQDSKLNALSGDLQGWCHDINRDKSYRTAKTATPVNKLVKEINSRDFLLRNSLQPSKPFIFYHYHDPRKYIEQYRRENIVNSVKFHSSQSRNKAFQKMQREQESRMTAFKNQYATQLSRENASLGSTQPSPQKQSQFTHWWRIGLHQPVLGPSPLITSGMLATYDEPTMNNHNGMKKQILGGNSAITQIRTSSARSNREDRGELSLHLSPGHLTERYGNNERMSLSKIEGSAKEFLLNGITTISARRKVTIGKIKSSQSISAKLSTTFPPDNKDSNSDPNLKQNEVPSTTVALQKPSYFVVRDGHSKDFATVLTYKLNELFENRKHSFSSLSSLEEESKSISNES